MPSKINFILRDQSYRDYAVSIILISHSGLKKNDNYTVILKY